MSGENKLKKYYIELSNELSVIYEDIAKLNQKKVEECMAIILGRVIHTMLQAPGDNKKTND